MSAPCASDGTRTPTAGPVNLVTEPRRTVNVSLVDGWWVVQTIKWNGTRAVWTGRAERYRELPSAVAAAEWRQKHRVAAGQSCVVQLCQEAQEAMA